MTDKTAPPPAAEPATVKVVEISTGRIRTLPVDQIDPKLHRTATALDLRIAGVA
jgi:hypothetical protein